MVRSKSTSSRRPSYGDGLHHGNREIKWTLAEVLQIRNHGLDWSRSYELVNGVGPSLFSRYEPLLWMFKGRLCGFYSVDFLMQAQCAIVGNIN